MMTNIDPGIGLPDPPQSAAVQFKDTSNSVIIVGMDGGGRVLESDLKGGMEVSMGHFSEDECFPAKAPNKNIVDQDHRMSLDPDKGQVQVTEQDYGPTTVANLNIKPRHHVCLQALVDSMTALDLTDSDDFNDVRGKEDEVRYLGKSSVQEETSDIFDTYKSQMVVCGTRSAVSDLLTDTDQLIPSTHGVILDHTLRSHSGRYNENEEFTVIRQLGKGGYGEVDLCQHKSGKIYATKKIFGKFKKKEVEVLMSLAHENITSFLGYINRNGTHEILMQYGGVSLETFVKTENWQEVWSLKVVMTLGVQGFSALRYMHSLRILHLDVKPKNVCIDFDSQSNPVIKLTDFGISKTLEQAITLDGWTPEYTSPEACQSIMVSQKPERAALFCNYDVTGKADVFSFGLTLYFMFGGSHAVLDIWKHDIKPETFAALGCRFIRYLAKSPNYICEKVVETNRPFKVNELMSGVLAGDPGERMAAGEACHFIKTEILVDEVTPPTILPPDSPGSQSVDMSDDLTCQRTFDPAPPPKDISLQKGRSPGGGKDIKNNLRQKLLRRRSTGPYHRQDSLRTTELMSEVKAESNVDCCLPVFAALLDD